MSDHRFVLIRKDLLSNAFDSIDYADGKNAVTSKDMEDIAGILASDVANLDRLIGDAMAAQLVEGVNYIGYTYDVSVAGQDVCDVTVTFTKKDGKTAHDLRLEAEAEVARLKKALLIPGVQRCAKCNFRRNSMVMSARTGGISAAEAKPESCPNGCGPLWPVTWEEDLRAEWANQEQEWKHLTEQRDYVVSLLKKSVNFMAGKELDALSEQERQDISKICQGMGVDQVLMRLTSIANPLGEPE